MAWLYPMHEKEKQTKEQREVIVGFLRFLFGADFCGDAVVDRFLGIDRDAYVREELEMAQHRKAQEESRARGEPPGSTIPLQQRPRSVRSKGS
jgi:hypothetical protein